MQEPIMEVSRPSQVHLVRSNGTSLPPPPGPPVSFKHFQTSFGKQFRRLSSLDSLRDVKCQAVHITRSLSRKSSLRSNSTTTNQSESTTIYSDAYEKKKQSDAQKGFQSTAGEIGFCLSMALTQLLGEYLISGFSVLLPTILKQFAGSGTAASFWPASVLSLVSCSTILMFARLSDMYGGYPIFMVAVAWLFLWTFVAGFSGSSIILLDVSRAMQGLAIAAYTPSSYALFGAIYPAGPRRNIALGIYGSCAPLGFFAGILISAVLPEDQWQWFFWIAAILAFIALVTAYLTIPSDGEDRKSLNLSMDWAGAITILAGVILVVYALTASSSSSASPESTWQSISVLAPFTVGMVSLLSAVYIEAYVAKCPLLPMSFFKPKSVKPFTLAVLFFYGTFGTWLFTTSAYLPSAYGISNVTLAAWFAPMAVGGFLIATCSGRVMHRLQPTILLLFSGFAWLTAPLLLALGSPSAGYWPFVFPAMVCGTLGIDLTFTISTVFLSSVQPLKYQGLAGAVSSLLVNLAIAFSLAFAGIVEGGGEGEDVIGEEADKKRRMAFWFAGASAMVGVIIVAAFVRISRAVVDEAAPEEQKEKHGGEQQA